MENYYTIRILILMGIIPIIGLIRASLTASPFYFSSSKKLKLPTK